MKWLAIIAIIGMLVFVASAAKETTANNLIQTTSPEAVKSALETTAKKQVKDVSCKNELF